MKLRNLLFGTMIAMAFTACSSDNDPIIEPTPDPVEEGAATLSLKLNGAIATKADGATDADLKDLTAYIFKGDALEKSVVIPLTPTDAGSYEKQDIELTSGAKKVVVLANIGKVFPETITYSVLKGETLDYNTNEEFGGFTMNSQVFDISLARGDNYLGYDGTQAGTHFMQFTNNQPVKLYRNVAKVNLASVEVFKNEITVDGQKVGKYNEPQLKVKKVFILNGMKEAKILAEAQWGSTAINNSGVFGVPFDVEDSDQDYTGWLADAVARIAAGKAAGMYFDAVAEADYDYSAELGQDVTMAAQGEGKWTSTTEPMYVYGNDVVSNSTLLVVQADFSYLVADGNGGEVRQTEADRYYSVKIGDLKYEELTAEYPNFPGIKNAANNGKVLRNIQYNIALGVKGPGSDNPLVPPPAGADAYLNILVEVVAFGEVSQAPVID